MSAAIPVRELSHDAIRAVKLRARRRGYEYMFRGGRAEDKQQVTPRDIRANLDLGINNGTEPNEFAPAAGTAGTDLVYVNNALTSNKFLVIFGFSIIDAHPIRPFITAIRFRSGAGAVTKLEVDLQRGYGYDHWAWFIDDPVWYGPSETVYIELEVGVTWALGDVEVPISGYVFEPAGQVAA